MSNLFNTNVVIGAIVAAFSLYAMYEAYTAKTRVWATSFLKAAAPISFLLGLACFVSGIHHVGS